MEWLVSTTPGAAAAAAIEIGRAFIAVAAREKRQRMRDLSGESVAFIRSTMQARLDSLHENPRKTNASLGRRIGLIELGERFAVGIAAPFGRVETDQLRKLAEATATEGIEEIRLSPWRALYAGVSGRQSGQDIVDAAKRE